MNISNAVKRERASVRKFNKLTASQRETIKRKATREVARLEKLLSKQHEILVVCELARQAQARA